MLQEHPITYGPAALCVSLWWCVIFTSGREGGRGERGGGGEREREREEMNLVG